VDPIPKRQLAIESEEGSDETAAGAAERGVGQQASSGPAKRTKTSDRGDAALRLLQEIRGNFTSEDESGWLAAV